MKEPEDCYFFVDPQIPLEDQCMSILCISCHDKDMPDTGWFYKGSEEGYGPFDYQCCKCGKCVYRPSFDEEESDEVECKKD